MFSLINIIVCIALVFLDRATGSFDPDLGYGLLTGIYLLALLIPGIAVSVRRLHDIGRSGWWFLINLIPIVGALIYLFFTVKDSKPGDNAYGANPKGVVA